MSHSLPPLPPRPVQPWYTRPSLNWLLALIPIAIGLRFAGTEGTVGMILFIVAGLAIVPLAGLMGEATEHLSEKVGPGLGGLLNATFGNAAELIIGIMLLQKGFAKAALEQADPDPAVSGAAVQTLHNFFEIAKASLTGSIVGNVLLVLGASVLAGGLFYKKQVFNRTASSMGVTVLALAAVALVMPAVFAATVHQPGANLADEERRLAGLSETIAVILVLAYGLNLWFSLRTHKHLFASEQAEQEAAEEVHANPWTLRTSIIVLVAATVGVAIMSEFLSAAVESAGHSLGMNELFIGVFVVAIVGNAAEHSTAVLMAMKNKMDLAVNIAIGSSIQIALFVAPVLVGFSALFAWMYGVHHIMDLHFTLLEVIAVVLSVGVLALVVQDGESNWLEGAMLLTVYVIMGLAFFWLPDTKHTSADGTPKPAEVKPAVTHTK